MVKQSSLFFVRDLLLFLSWRLPNRNFSTDFLASFLSRTLNPGGQNALFTPCITSTWNHRVLLCKRKIAFALKQAELSTLVEQVCREIGISDPTFYNWKKKYGGLAPSELRRVRQLEEKKTKLKKFGSRKLRTRVCILGTGACIWYCAG